MTRVLLRWPTRTLLVVALAGAQLAGCSDSGTTTVAPVATTISAVSGNAQTMVAGATATSALVVRVLDQNGAAMSGVPVTFGIATGGGALSNTTATTDASGMAASAYTAGTSAGTATVTATAAGLAPVTFTVTITALPAGANTIAIVSGNNQSVVAGAATANPFVVKVTSSAGAAVSGAAVTFAVVTGGGTLGTTTATTDANGNATATYTAGASAGVATVTATVAGGSSVSFSTTVTTGTSGLCTGITETSALVLCQVNAFTATLTTAQATAVQLTFTSTLAARWSNLPCGLSCRNGLQFSTLSAAQLTAALAVAQAALSSTGYATFDAIRKADTYLSQQGGGSGYGEGIYMIAFLGTPSATGRWMLQLGGHHYAANIAFNGTATPSITVTGTPFFLGVEPQSFTLNGVTYTPLQSRKVAMYTMINALDATQKAAAQLSTQFDDVLVGPNKDNQFPAQQGVVVSTLSAAQQALVKTAIRAWVNDMPAANAAAVLLDYEADTSLAKTRLAWSKSTDSTVAGSYIRIDGPRVWIEFACQNGVVFRTQIHFHTIWRDKIRDYGGTISTASLAHDAFTQWMVAARNTFEPLTTTAGT